MGCVIIPVSSSSGFRPRPSAGTGTWCWNGGAATVITRRKNARMPSIVASAQGYNSRAPTRWRTIRMIV